MPVDELDRMRQPIHEEIEEETEEIKDIMQRLSADIAQNQSARKFDIKQLKAEIWSIIETRLP